MGKNCSLLLITGATAVGKSTVGWNVFSTLGARGVVSAYIDVDQLGFISGGPSRQPKGENLLSTWRGYHAAGAQCVVIVARGAPHMYDGWLQTDLVTRVHLDAEPGDLAERVVQRAGGGGPRLAGDSLVGAPRPMLSEISRRAAEEALEFRQDATASWTVIDTSDRDAANVTRGLLELLGPAPGAN